MPLEVYFPSAEVSLGFSVEVCGSHVGVNLVQKKNLRIGEPNVRSFNLFGTASPLRSHHFNKNDGR